MTHALNMLDFSITAEKRLPFALFEMSELREQLKLCEDQCQDERSLRRALLSATSIVEQQTGYVIGPRIVVQSFDSWPAISQTGLPVPSMTHWRPGRGSSCDIPIGIAPIWPASEMATWLELVDDAGTETEKQFATCVDLELPGAIPVQITYYDPSGDLRTLNEGEHFHLDHRHRPPRIRLASGCSWPTNACDREIVIRMICGFKSLAEIELYKPELLDAISLATTDFYDGIPAEELVQRNHAIWNMIAFR